MNDAEATRPPVVARARWQYSLWMLILATTLIAAIAGLYVAYRQKRTVVREIIRLEGYHRHFGDTGSSQINALNYHWHVHLPPGASYRLCAKILDPPIEAGAPFSRMAPNESVRITPGEHQIQVSMDRLTDSMQFDTSIDRKAVFPSLQLPADRLPAQIDSFYAPIPSSEPKGITLPLELGDMISVESSTDAEGNEVIVRKSYLRVWIEEVEP